MGNSLLENESAPFQVAFIPNQHDFLLQTLKPSPQLLPHVSKVIKLTPVQEVVFGLALTHSSNLDTQNFAFQFVKQKLPELIRSYIDIGEHCDLHDRSLYSSCE